jgi:hypothetical protein
MMALQSWFQQAQQLLEELKAIDFGYPLGTNAFRAPQPPGMVEETLAAVSLRGDAPLMEFYSRCDGLSLPDVQVGYFIKPLAKLLVNRPDSEPSELIGPFAGKVLPVGSTGGGGLFVLRFPEKDVLYVPPGPLHNGVYDGSERHVKRLAPDFPSFLSLLLADIEAFVKDKSHSYLV